MKQIVKDYNNKELAEDIGAVLLILPVFIVLGIIVFGFLQAVSH